MSTSSSNNFYVWKKNSMCDMTLNKIPYVICRYIFSRNTIYSKEIHFPPCVSFMFLLKLSNPISVGLLLCPVFGLFISL